MNNPTFTMDVHADKVTYEYKDRLIPSPHTVCLIQTSEYTRIAIFLPYLGRMEAK